jgi:hypothetical protein
VKRHYEPAERELDGQAVPRGFGILQGSFTTFRNPLTQLPVGQRGRVELEIWRQNVPANTTEEQLEYYRDRSRKIPLPLKDEGAYLVVCRGDDLHASGLVLVTPLVVEVQEEAASGQVRATVKDATKDAYVSDVHVKVIGTRNPDFVSGETDLRGVFVADTIQGTSTVIAEAGAGRYAFYRGTLELGPPPAAATPPAPQPAEQAPGGGQTEQLLQELYRINGAIQQMQGENLQKLYQRNKQGVKAMDAF